ncbi:hypothetical protein RCL1_002320 [Eukaryota sp. TZLM3-RCL]
MAYLSSSRPLSVLSCFSDDGSFVINSLNQSELISNCFDVVEPNNSDAELPSCYNSTEVSTTNIQLIRSAVDDLMSSSTSFTSKVSLLQSICCVLDIDINDFSEREITRLFTSFLKELSD